MLERALHALHAARMVVGHTTQRDGHVLTRCGGALQVVDTGISDHYGGHLAVLELRPAGAHGDAWVDYPSGPVDVPDP
ncbi:MAG: hypothetical protein R3F59_23610 [Myxococcota bacterium]